MSSCEFSPLHGKVCGKWEEVFLWFPTCFPNHKQRKINIFNLRFIWLRKVFRRWVRSEHIDGLAFFRYEYAESILDIIERDAN